MVFYVFSMLIGCDFPALLAWIFEPRSYRDKFFVTGVDIFNLSAGSRNYPNAIARKKGEFSALASASEFLPSSLTSTTLALSAPHKQIHI